MDPTISPGVIGSRHGMVCESPCGGVVGGVGDDGAEVSVETGQDDEAAAKEAAGDFGKAVLSD